MRVFNDTLDAGDTYEQAFTLYDVNGQGVNIVGAVCTAIIYAGVAKTAPIALQTNPTCSGQGVIMWSLTPAQTATLSPPNCYYEIDIVFPDTSELRVCQGFLTVQGRQVA